MAAVRNFNVKRCSNVLTGILLSAAMLGAEPSTTRAQDAVETAAMVILAARTVQVGTDPSSVQQQVERAAAHEIGLFPAASDPLRRQGFARVINHSGESGTVRIDAYDNEGTHRGPLSLSIDANETAHFNSDDLEMGNADKGLPQGTGEGTGDWRLRLSSPLELEVLSYIRTDDGFLTSMHDVVPETSAGHRVATFNPGGNIAQVSKLRIVNRGEQSAEVEIEGIDDRGQSPGSAVRLSIAPGASSTLTAQQLESGEKEGLSGALGTGSGKWQLVVRSGQPIDVMSLLSSPTGHLTNLSTVPDNTTPGANGTDAMHTVPLFPAASDPLRRQGFARVINHSGEGGTVRIDAYDNEGTHRGPLSLSIDANETVHFNSDDLEMGNADKGLPQGTGEETGDWRLRLSSPLELEVLSYIRTDDGFLTSMHDVVPETSAGHRVATFNPGGNIAQVSKLRIVNRGEQSAEVEIEGIDDRGQSPGSAVRLSIAPGASSTLTAQQLESGEKEGLSGALGTGSGKWQLVVRSGQPIDMMSLLSSPTGHLTNLSTTPRGALDDTDFVITPSAPTAVRPFQTISLEVPGGLRNSDYLVLMDLSGTGAFDGDGIVEVAAITTDDDRILIASPMTQFLPEENETLGFSVQVRREADGQLSNVLHFSVDDTAIPAELAGFPTIVLDVLMKSIYLSADDPLLSIEAPSIRPGLMVVSARRLNLDTTFSDVQAAAILRSVYGVDVLSASGGSSSGTARTMPNSIAPHARYAARDVEDPFEPLLKCVRVAFGQFSQERYDQAEIDRCLRVGIWKSIKAHINNTAITSIPALGRGLASTLIKESFKKGAVAGLNRLVSWVDGSRSPKLLRLVEGSDEESGTRHYGRNALGRLVPTKRAREVNYESVRDINKEAADAYPDLIGDAERDYADQGLDDEKRAAFANLVNEADRQQGDAESIERLEAVYTGEADPLDAIKNDTGLGRRVGKNCGAGYEEFPVDDKTSTCVFQSLIERNCYAGSRRVPELEGVDTCLYYSLDFFRSDGTCRANYAKVYYNGRWTCRWAELGPSAPLGYTLHKELDDDDSSGCDEIPSEFSGFGIVVTCTQHTELGTVAEVADRYRRQGYVRVDETEVWRQLGLTPLPVGPCEFLVHSSYDNILTGGEWNGRMVHICPFGDGAVVVIAVQIDF